MMVSLNVSMGLQPRCTHHTYVCFALAWCKIDVSRNPWTFLCTRKLRRLVSFSLNFVFLLRVLQEVQTNPGNLLNLRNDEGIYLCLIEITGRKTGIRKTSEGIARRSVNTKSARKLGWIGELREGARVMGLGRGTLIQLEGGLGGLGLP